MGRFRELRRGRRLAIGLAAVLVLAGIAVSAWRLRPTPDGGTPPPDVPPSPLATYAGPYRNIHPAVQYVGDAACADCHADVAAAYKHSAMGRSLRPIAAVAPLQRYDAS